MNLKIEGSVEVPVSLGYATAASIATGPLVSTAACLAIKDSKGNDTITLSCNETDVNKLLVIGKSRLVQFMSMEHHKLEIGSFLSPQHFLLT